MRPDGVLDPAKFASWRRAHADALRALPGLEGRFADAAKATEAITGAAAARRAALDEYQQGAVAKLLNLSEPQDMVRTVGTIFGKSDAVASMRALVRETSVLAIVSSLHQHVYNCNREANCRGKDREDCRPARYEIFVRLHPLKTCTNHVVAPAVRSAQPRKAKSNVFMINYKDKLKYITPPNIRKCIFCGDVPPLTGEHVFPRWSHKYLPPETQKKYESIRGVRNPYDSNHHEIIRPGDIRHWTVKCVCHPHCNNGWMRKKIEDTTKPLLIPLITGEACRIFPADQARIAVWAVMKAMVAEWTIRKHATTNHMQRKYLMRHYLPPKNGWGVWIGHFVSDKNKKETERYHPLWEAHPFLLMPDNLAARRPNRIATYYNSQASTQIIGQLLIHVFRSPMPNLIPRWKFTLPDRGSLFRIWPPTQTSIAWPGKTLSDFDALIVANEFINFVLRIQRRDMPSST